jgi:FkbM family methyltransferase
VIHRIRSHPGLRALLFSLLRNVTASRAFAGGEGRLWFPAGTHLNLFFSRHAGMEPHVTDNLRRLVRPGDTVFDVGANIGYYTVLFSRWAAQGRVVAVEPDRGNLGVLRENIRRNGLANVATVEEAVSDARGSATLYRDQVTGRTSSLEQDATHVEGPAPVQADQVPVTTLDDLSAAHGYPDVIKCDVEGHELAAFRGARETLSRGPILMLESHAATRAELGRLLAEHGYRFCDADQPLGRAPRLSPTIDAFNVIGVTPKGEERLAAW